MIYEIAHIIKQYFSFLWDAMEWCNSKGFKVLYGKKLRNIDALIRREYQSPYDMRMLTAADCKLAADFFASQPESAFEHFRPHPFDEQSLKRFFGMDSVLAFMLYEKAAKTEKMIGYCFMRSFVHGCTYRGYMVDYDHYSKGIAKEMGYCMNSVGDYLELKMFKSISPKNTRSLGVTEAVCNTELIKTLDNGDLLLRCYSKAKSDKKNDEA